MSTPSFIAGDWGTSHLRLTLCDERGRALAHRGGPGVAQRTADCPSTLAALIGPWREAHGTLPVILCGMVGSTIGWTPVPYLPCPARAEDLAHGVLGVGDGQGPQVQIVPGLSCRNRCGAPDVMRGEETQVLGALQLDERLRRGRHLVCLPGTHTKWVHLDDGVVSEFTTAVTGELFAIVKQHSVLIRATDADPAADHEAYVRHAIAQTRAHGAASLVHLLFECRSRQLAGEFSPAQAAAYLSGLVVGADVAGALALLAAAEATPVTLIGTPQLTATYAIALAAHGCQPTQVDGEAASLAGLTAIYERLHGKDQPHAA
jgi:2-dehydro-3-deoxygalactonokinase